jgi:hypothetical protein
MGINKLVRENTLPAMQGRYRHSRLEIAIAIKEIK